MFTHTGRIESLHGCMHKEAENLLQAVKSVAMATVQQSVYSLADLLHQLSGHCNVNMVNDALREWHESLEDHGSKFTRL